jgi:hypothetical protein
MASQTDWYKERGHAFGRGSPVRDYWLERCDGFEAIGTNGRHLGRVSRFETPQGAAFLRVGGRRSRVVPVSAVERVWPAASMLVIADPDLAEKNDGRSANQHSATPGVRGGESQNASEGNLPAGNSRPGWEDETIPWWDLVPENRLPDEAAKQLRAPSVPTLPWSVIRRHTSDGGTAVAELSQRIGHHSRKLVALARRRFRDGWRVTCRGMRVFGEHCLAARAFGANLAARGRLRLGRLLVRLAVWVAGDDRQLEHEIALRRTADSAK